MSSSEQAQAAFFYFVQPSFESFTACMEKEIYNSAKWDALLKEKALPCTHRYEF